jgi:hypothetical protein
MYKRNKFDKIDERKIMFRNKDGVCFIFRCHSDDGYVWYKADFWSDWKQPCLRGGSTLSKSKHQCLLEVVKKFIRTQLINI